MLSNNKFGQVFEGIKELSRVNKHDRLCNPIPAFFPVVLYFMRQSLWAFAHYLHWNAICEEACPFAGCQFTAASLFPCPDIGTTSASSVTWLGCWASLSNCLMWFLKKGIIASSSSLEYGTLPTPLLICIWVQNTKARL